MATARVAVPPVPHLLVGQTVHYRQRERCWAGAIVESGPQDQVQVYLFPLPPSHPMPQAPGTFIRHDARMSNDSWHRLAECIDGQDQPDGQPQPPKSRRRRRRG